MSKILSNKIQMLYYVISIALIAISYFFFSNTAVAEVKAEDLEGYEVDFTSVGHEKEIEIVYQYYINDPLRDTEFLTKEFIIVNLYDIDNDGKKEIIYMIYHPAYCGNRGCTFNILKQSDKKDKQGNSIYAPIRWSASKEHLIHELVINNIKILQTTTLGVHDLLLDLDTIWKWQGAYYKKVKDLKD